MTKRVLILNEDGTAEVGGVKVRVVPVEPSRTLVDKGAQAIAMWEAYCVWPTSWDAVQVRQMRSDARKAYRAMLSAAALDLSGLPVVPSTHGFGSKGKEYDAGYKDGFAAALDAIGAAK